MSRLGGIGGRWVSSRPSPVTIPRMNSQAVPGYDCFNTTLVESFNKADGVLGPDLTWVATGSDAVVSGNQAAIQQVGGFPINKACILAYNLWTPDTAVTLTLGDWTLTPGITSDPGDGSPSLGINVVARMTAAEASGGGGFLYGGFRSIRDPVTGAVTHSAYMQNSTFTSSSLSSINPGDVFVVAFIGDNTTGYIEILQNGVPIHVQTTGVDDGNPVEGNNQYDGFYLFGPPAAKIDADWSGPTVDSCSFERWCRAGSGGLTRPITPTPPTPGCLTDSFSGGGSGITGADLDWQDVYTGSLDLFVVSSGRLGMTNDDATTGFGGGQPTSDIGTSDMIVQYTVKDFYDLGDVSSTMYLDFELAARVVPAGGSSLSGWYVTFAYDGTQWQLTIVGNWWDGAVNNFTPSPAWNATNISPINIDDVLAVVTTGSGGTFELDVLQNGVSIVSGPLTLADFTVGAGTEPADMSCSIGMFYQADDGTAAALAGRVALDDFSVCPA